MLRQRPSSGGAVPRSSLSSASSSPGFGHQRTASQGPQIFCSPGHQPHQHYHHPRPDWMSLQDIPDECHDAPEGCSCEEGASGAAGAAQNAGTIWDGNRKLFVQLLDDMDNIGQVAGVSEGSARRRRKARELFTDWLFNRKTPEVKPSAVSPFAARNADNRRFSGDFTDFDVKSPVGGLPTSVNHRPLPGRLERQAPSRRSCGLIGEVQRRNLPQAKARPNSINLSTEHDEADSGYHSGNSAVLGAACKKQGPGEFTLTREDLKRRVEKFNATNTHGLLMEMPVDRNTTFQGFIRVHMNLIRPISIRISTKPLSIYDTIARKRRKEKAERPDGRQRDSSPYGAEESMMSFRLPKNTSKVIHITSMTTTVEVINVLLSKFNISDSPRKFSLYERTELPESKPTMRRMSEDEHPLMMCLSWADKGAENLDYNKFVLQENDCGEIMWEAFSLPELESFLTVLNKEERECIQQVVDKFRILKGHMERRISEMSMKPVRDGKMKKKAVLFA